VIANDPLHDRRRDPRLANNIPIRITQDDQDAVTETANISRSGAYCRISNYIEPMTKLKIHLLLPIRKNGKNVTKKISCHGVVVRTEKNEDGKHYNVAIFFNDISQRDSESIADYVSSYLEQDSKKA